MSRGINKVILVGNLGQDPETRHMPSGDAVTNISIATSEQWKDKKTGDQKERTEWHKVTFFGRLASIITLVNLIGFTQFQDLTHKPSVVVTVRCNKSWRTSLWFVQKLPEVDCPVLHCPAVRLCI